MDPVLLFRDKIDKVCQSNYHGDPALLDVLDPGQNVAFNNHYLNVPLYIARRFLLPKQLAQNGLLEAHVQPTESALLHTVTHYTQEARVRSLESAVGGNCALQGDRMGSAG